MNDGSVDLFTSRRTNFLDCEYWLVAKDDFNKNKNVLTHENLPQGEFSAMIENSYENTTSVISDSFMFDKNSLLISTQDCIDGLKKNCLVKTTDYFGNEVVWIVDSVGFKPIRGNYQFELKFKAYIQLRR